jgi:hypothetical protein
MPPEKASLRLGSFFTSCACGTSSRNAMSVSPRLSIARRVADSGTLRNTSRFTDGIFRQ